MARIAGVDLPNKKRAEIGLTYIYGIGRTRALSLLHRANVDATRRSPTSLRTKSTASVR